MVICHPLRWEAVLPSTTRERFSLSSFGRMKAAANIKFSRGVKVSSALGILSQQTCRYIAQLEGRHLQKSIDINCNFVGHGAIV